MICPLVCDTPDYIVVEASDLEIMGATDYVDEANRGSAFGNRFWRRMTKLRPHRGPYLINSHPSTNNEVVDANTIRGRNA